MGYNSIEILSHDSQCMAFHPNISIWCGGIDRKLTAICQSMVGGFCLELVGAWIAEAWFCIIPIAEKVKDGERGEFKEAVYVERTMEAHFCYLQFTLPRQPERPSLVMLSLTAIRVNRTGRFATQAILHEDQHSSILSRGRTILVMGTMTCLATTKLPYPGKKPRKMPCRRVRLLEGISGLGPADQ